MRDSIRIFLPLRRIFLRKVYSAIERRLQLTFFPKRPSSCKVIDVAWHKSFIIHSPRTFFPLMSTSRHATKVTRYSVNWYCKMFSFPTPSVGFSVSSAGSTARTRIKVVSFLFLVLFFVSFSFSLKKHDY